jgi:NADH:ubiquinone oxidoreductase subunit F (NADH-binding)
VVSGALTPVLTARWDEPDSFTMDGYRRAGGYRALGRAMGMPPGDIIAMVKQSGLRGRGGAGFPTGIKWGFIPQGYGKPHYLVVNADESEPGTCKDIPLMLASPHLLIEGAVITAYAIRASRAFIYVRGEVLHAVRRLQQAVAEACEAGYLGTGILGSGYDLDIVVHAGAGAYICGEETALLDSLEGLRGLPRLKPPFPALAGLYSCPTVINNVETIASVPFILANGPEWFAGMGTEKSRGAGIFSLSGHVTAPGQYEAPLGITLRKLLELAGGVRAGQEAGTSYTGLERARAVLLAGFEPEDESPMVFLRLRKAARTQGLAVYSIAPFASRGLARLSGVLLPTLPGTEAQAIDALAADRTGPAAASGPDGARPGSQGGAWGEAAGALRGGGAVILAGERLAEVPGALSALARLAAATGARLAWIPRRAGERGAIEAGAVPNLLPGGRPVSDPDARAAGAPAGGVATQPGEPGRDTSGILTAAAAGEIGALVVAGVDPGDLPAPAAALAALAAARFVVSLELRVSAVTDRADVLLPVAAAAEKAGTFVNWEGRPGTFGPALSVPGLQPDLEVLGRIADAMDVHLGLPDAAAARREIAGLGSWPGIRPAAPAVPSRPPARPGAGQAVLATWRQLLDTGRMQDGEPFLAGTARPPVARLSAATAAEAGTAGGRKVTVTTERGSVTVPVQTADMPARVVWLPAHSAGCQVRRALGAGHGTVVTLESAE